MSDRIVMANAFRRFRLAAGFAAGCILPAVSVQAAEEPSSAAPQTAPQAAQIMPKASQSLLLDITRIPGGDWAVVGDRGHVLRSKDGTTWDQASVPVSSMLTSVYFVDAEQGWAVGHDASIIKTEDGGRTWKLQHYKPEEEKPFLDIWFRSPRIGVAIGAYGLLMRTEDGGKTWALQDTTSLGDELITEPHLNAVRQLSNGDLFLVGEAGLLARSNDEGRSWTRLNSPYEGSFFGVGETQGKALLVAGLRGHLYRSTDGGNSWQPIETDIVSALNSVVVHGSDVYVFGNDGVVLRSQDDGRTFTKVQRSDRKGIATAAVHDQGLILVGDQGVRFVDAKGEDTKK